MPVGDHFSASPNTEACFPIGLVGCNECGLVQLKHEVCSNFIFGDWLRQVTIDHRQSTEIETKRLRGKKVVLLVGGISCPPVSFDRTKSQVSISLVPFLLELIGRQDEKSVSSYDSLVGEAVGLFQKKFGMVDEVHIDNSSNEAHPFHPSNLGKIDEYLDHIIRLIKPDGKISIRCPDIDAILDNGHLNYIYHEHQAYFSLFSLTKIMERKGFIGVESVTGVDEVDSRFSFSKEVPNKHRTRRWAGEKMPVNLWQQNPNIFDSFSARIRVRQDDARVALSTSETVIGYGASVAGICALYQFGLEGKIDCIVDDADDRVGMYSPHSNHRVFSSRSLTALNVRKTFILVPRYTKNIVARWQRLLGSVTSVGSV